MSELSLSQTSIRQAFDIIDPVFLNSPQFELDPLNDVLGTRLLLKVETLNPIRCFKGRGTDYFVKQRAPASPLVCASAGNFGQGMAYACRKHNIPLTIFAAANANPLKLERMKQLGAEVKLDGADFDAAKAAARAYAFTEGHIFVEDGRDIEVAIGAGTIGLELSHYPESINTVLIPVGNGALINGISTWFKANHPATQIIGVVAAGAPSMDLSWRAGQIILTETAETISDGIAVRTPVPEALQVMASTVDDMVQVSDEATLSAMKLLYQLCGIVVEPAGAVGFAAAMAYKDRFINQVIATPICGSNLTKAQMMRWLSVNPNA
ncbi:MAG: pyridoxal-phosphate dependent enzyme [Cyanobacteria bacterium J06635_1]